MTQQTVEVLAHSPVGAKLKDSQLHATASTEQRGVRHVPAGTGPAYWGPGELMTFLITGEETGGAYFWLRFRAAGRRPTAAHPQPRGRIVPIIEGSLTVQVGGIQSLHRPAILFIFPVELLTASETTARAT